MATDNIDYTDRYSGLLTPLPQGSWREREQDISNEIAAGPESTAAGFAWHFKDLYTKNIASLVASGDLVQAKKYYDDVRTAVESNRDHLLAMSQVSDTGKVADELARRANDILMGGYNQESVQMSDGSTVTIGQVLADGSPYLLNKDEELRRLSFGDKARGLYLDNDRAIKSIMDPFLRTADGKGGPENIPNRLQMIELADTYAGDSERINGIFGDGTGRLLDYVRETHKTSGNAAATLRTLVDYAEAYSSATGSTGAQLASQVVNGYNDLLSMSFRSVDKEGREVLPSNLSDAQRRTFDAVFIPAVREVLSRTGGAFDMHDPRIRRSMLEVMDTVAYTSALGGDLFASARGAGAGLNKMFGDYVAEAVTGVTHQPDNIITGVRQVRNRLANLITGGRTVAEVAESLTGDAARYLADTNSLTGTKSTCPEADGIAAEAHSFIAREMISGLASGKSPASAFDTLASTPGIRGKLAQSLSGFFHGRGRDELANRLAGGVLVSLSMGDRVNIEELISEMCFGETSKTLSGPALSTARAWYHGNVASQLAFSEEKAALRDKYLAEGFSDKQARRAIASIAEQASREASVGGNPLEVYRRAIDVGSYFTVGMSVGADGKEVPRIAKVVGPRSKAEIVHDLYHAPAGTFDSDRAYWDTVQQRLQQEYAAQEGLAEYIKRREAAEAVKNEDNW